MQQQNFYLQEKHHESWNMSRFHFHDYFELFLPLSTSGSIFVGDQVFPLSQDTLYLIGENTLHRTTSEGPHVRFVLHISQQALQSFSTNQTDFTRLAREPFRRATLTEGELEETLTLFEHLKAQPNDGSFGSDIRQTTALLSLLIYVTPILNLATAGVVSPSRDFLRISPILDYIRDNLAEPLNLDQIASSFYISKHYLCRIFKSATGFSVMEYIIHCRVLRARQLLQEGYSVQQAGELSGFSDNSHFIRTFGNLTGMSPGKYTKEYQAGDQVRMTVGVEGERLC